MAAPAPQAPIVNLNMVLDQVAKDKGIERSVLVDTLQNAIAQAAKKHFGQDRAIEATYNEEKQVVEVFQTLTVVERVEVEDPVKAVNQISLEEAGKKGIEAEVGDELLFQIFCRPEDEEEARVQDERYGDILRLKTYRKGFGRIAAQTAKQVIIQRTRDAARRRIPRRRRRAGGCLRGDDGPPGAAAGEGAARGKDRRRSLGRRLRPLRLQRAAAGRRQPGPAR